MFGKIELECWLLQAVILSGWQSTQTTMSAFIPCDQNTTTNDESDIYDRERLLHCVICHKVDINQCPFIKFPATVIITCCKQLH